MLLHWHPCWWLDLNIAFMKPVCQKFNQTIMSRCWCLNRGNCFTHSYHHVSPLSGSGVQQSVQVYSIWTGVLVYLINPLIISQFQKQKMKFICNWVEAYIFFAIHYIHAIHAVQDYFIIIIYVHWMPGAGSQGSGLGCIHSPDVDCLPSVLRHKQDATTYIWEGEQSWRVLVGA